MNPIRRLRVLQICVGPYLRNLANEGRYKTLTESEVWNHRSSDTVFIFGSGHSLCEINDEEWACIQNHDTFGFNWFVRQDFVDVDYHLVREVASDDFDKGASTKELKEYASNIRSSPRYDDTIYIVQGGWKAINGNRLIGQALLPQGARIFRYFNRERGGGDPPSESFENGITHGPGTLADCVNIAYLLGWSRIILCGVDLYDRRYFWLDEDETREQDKQRGASHDQEHNTAPAIVPLMASWRDYLRSEGVELAVENSRSLLADVLPVYDIAEDVVEDVPRKPPQ